MSEKCSDPSVISALFSRAYCRVDTMMPARITTGTSLVANRACKWALTPSEAAWRGRAEGPREDDRQRGPRAALMCEEERAEARCVCHRAMLLWSLTGY